MAFSIPNILFLLSLIFFFASTSALNNTSSITSLDTNLSSLRNFCKNRAYPEVCFDSLKLSFSIKIDTNLITYLLQTLQFAISDLEKLTKTLLNAGESNNIIEKQRGTIQDCQELHQITLSSLKRISVSGIQESDSRKLSDARTYLSAALTNKNTCLEGLDSASGPLKPVLVDALTNTYKHVSNSLSILPKPVIPKKGRKNRRLLGFPRWVSKKDRRILQSNDDDYDDDSSEVITVAADGSGNFSTITDAIKFAPNNSDYRIFIYVKQGLYNENVEIPKNKPNIVLLGDGSDVTFITGSRSVGDGWTTFGSATLAVSGEGFLARDITIENTAGPEKHQAVALRVNADLVALYRCTINGYQDTLYTHSFRQFYRECTISGTVDYIFGNAAAIFQGCNIITRKPMQGQFTVITAQSRDSSDEDTGISIQNCSIVATKDQFEAFTSKSVKSYLGRPWKVYSRTVILDSFIDGFIDEAGWIEWSNEGDQDTDSLYYGEYNNNGAGSLTDNRVKWSGYHVMEDDDAYDFTVPNFINGDEWLDSTSFPYDGEV